MVEVRSLEEGWVGGIRGLALQGRRGPTAEGMSWGCFHGQREERETVCLPVAGSSQSSQVLPKAGPSSTEHPVGTICPSLSVHPQLPSKQLQEHCHPGTAAEQCSLGGKWAWASCGIFLLCFLVHCSDVTVVS